MAYRPKVFLTQSIPSDFLTELKNVCDVIVYNERIGGGMKISRDELLKSVRGIDVLHVVTLPRIDKEVLDAAGPQLKMIAVQSVGLDHVDIAECMQRNIQVSHTPDVLTDAVAEGTIALVLATTRCLNQEIVMDKSGNWDKIQAIRGKVLKNSVVGIVGLGRIGTAVAKLLQGFEVAGMVYSGTSPKDSAGEVSAKYVSFDELCSISDFVIVCCSANPENLKMFNKRTFQSMKPDAVFINVARGGLVDQEALYEALVSGQILAAGLDVTSPEPIPPEHPLVSLDNCIVLPHLGAATVKARTAMVRLCVQNILAALRTEPLITPVPYSVCP